MGDVAFYVMLVALFGTFGLALWADWSRHGYRLVLSAVGAIASVAAIVSFVFVKGTPRVLEYDFTLDADKKYEVLGFKVVEDEAIYVLVSPMDGDDVPVYYEIPWTKRSSRLASDLLDSMNRTRARGGTVVMEFRFEPSLETREPKFYDMPVPAPPPKPVPEGRAEEFEL